jgi:hypothetical protein
MNWRRYFLALAATSILTLIVDVLLNAIVFRAVYKRAAAFLLPPNELNVRVPIGWTALLVIVAAFGFLLVLSRGLRFGLVLAVAGVAGVAGIGSIVAWPAELLFAIGVQQFVNGILLGAVFGVVYREPAAGSPR